MTLKCKYLEQSDDFLMELVARGDDKAFEELITRYQQTVLNLAFRFLGDEQEAKDAAQETFLRLLQAAERYQPTTQFKPFVLRITKNLCIDYIRKRKPVYLAEPPDYRDRTDPHAELELAQLGAILRKAVVALPENQRMALLLNHFEGLRYAEVAEIMETSVAAVESLLVRAKRTLRAKMKEFR